MSTRAIPSALPALQPAREVIGVLLLISLPVTLLDCWLWFKLVPKGFPAPAAWLLHLVFLLVIYLTVLGYQRRGWDLRLCGTIAIMATVLGPLGFALGVLAIFFYLIFKSKQLDSKRLLEDLLPEFREHPIAEAAHRLSTGLDKVDSDTTPIPFLDVMGYGSLEQKRAVIGVSLRYFSPELTSVLRKGLADKTNSIRVLAATAMVALEEKYYATLLDLQADLERHPDDLDALAAYAKHCMNFALSEILGEERAAAMRDNAIKAYEVLAKSNEASEEIACHLARLYLISNRPQDALQALEPYAKAVSQMSLDAINFYGEALYRLRRYDELRGFSQRALKALGDAHADSEETRSILVLWGEGKGVEAKHA